MSSGTGRPWDSAQAASHMRQPMQAVRSARIAEVSLKSVSLSAARADVLPATEAMPAAPTTFSHPRRSMSSLLVDELAISMRSEIGFRPFMFPWLGL
jgi:hypothetical protein